MALRAATTCKSLAKTIMGRCIATDVSRFSSDPQAPHPADEAQIMIPPYIEKTNETTQVRRSRLQYQSRKRGMLENGILLSTFAAEHLKDMNDCQLNLYDQLINQPSNDWDIYYWATNVRPTPPEFDNEIMDMFKVHVQNTNKDKRYHQPALTIVGDN